MSDAERQLQLIDGPGEHQGIHAVAALSALIRSGRVPFAARAIDLGDMTTGAAGDLCGLPADAAGTVATGAPATDTVGDLVLGERRLRDPAGDVFCAAPSDGSAERDVLRIPAAVAGEHRAAAAGALRPLLGVVADHLITLHALHADEHGLDLVVDPLLGRDFSGIVGGSPPALDQVEDWLAQAADGLWAAAKHGVIHGDLDPRGLVLGTDGRVRLWGFALGACRRAADPDHARRVQAYRAPEATERDAPTHAGDVFALAAIGYHLLAGRPPFPDGEERRHALTVGPPPLAERDTRIPPALDHALAAALHADPGTRTTSAKALARAVRDAIHGPPQRRSSTHAGISGLAGGSSAAATVPAPPERTPPPVPRRGGKLLAATLVLGCALVAVVAWRIRTTPDALPPTSDSGPMPPPPPTAGTAAAPPAKPPAEDVATTSATERPAEVGNGAIALLAAWQEAEVAEDWAAAHAHATRLADRHPERVAADRVRLPLLIEPDPAVADAAILVDGVRIGTGRALHRYPPGADALLVVAAPGRRPAVSRLAARADAWRWSATLPELEAMRWVRVLADRPVAGARCIAPGRILIPGRHHALALDATSGRQRVLRVADAGRALAPPHAHEDLAICVRTGGVRAFDRRGELERWHLTAGATTPFTTDACIAPHELLPGRHKLWVSAAPRHLRAIVLHPTRGEELRSTLLPLPASAAPALAMIDARTSALAVPCGRTLVVLDGASVDADTPARELFRHGVGARIVHAPLALRHAQRPWLIVATDDRRVLAIDPRRTARQRIAAEWHLAASAVAAPVALGDGRVLLALADGGLVALDCDRPGQITWTADENAAVTGAPAVDRAAGQVVCAHRDGTITIRDTRDGRTLNRYRLDLTPLGAPALGESHLVVATAEGLALGLAR